MIDAFTSTHNCNENRTLSITTNPTIWILVQRAYKIASHIRPQMSGSCIDILQLLATHLKWLLWMYVYIDFVVVVYDYCLCYYWLVYHQPFVLSIVVIQAAVVRSWEWWEASHLRVFTSNALFSTTSQPVGLFLSSGFYGRPPLMGIEPHRGRRFSPHFV